jgi:hypothetical protein
MTISTSALLCCGEERAEVEEEEEEEEEVQGKEGSPHLSLPPSLSCTFFSPSPALSCSRLTLTRYRALPSPVLDRMQSLDFITLATFEFMNLMQKTFDRNVPLRRDM